MTVARYEPRELIGFDSVQLDCCATGPALTFSARNATTGRFRRIAVLLYFSFMRNCEFGAKDGFDGMKER